MSGWVDPTQPFELRLPGYPDRSVLTGVLFEAPSIFHPSIDGGHDLRWALAHGGYTARTWPG